MKGPTRLRCNIKRNLQVFVDPAGETPHGSQMDKRISLFRQARFGVLVGIAALLGAAGPDKMHVLIVDVAPFAQPEPAPAKPLSFQNTIYQAAPVPDEDVEAPPGKVQTEAQLSPKFLSPTSLYQGDGYSYASSQQGTLERRKAGAAGLGLSVPVEQ